MHERYEEMCAVAAIGELPEAECREFQAHLLICGQCQQTFGEFCRISADYLGSFATQSPSNSGKAEDDLNTAHLFAGCLARAAEQRRERPEESLPPKDHGHGLFAGIFHLQTLRAAAYSFAAILLILVAGVAGFQISQRRALSRANPLPEPPPLAVIQPENPAAKTRDTEAGDSLATARKMKDLSVRYSLLLHEKRELEEQLSSARDRLQELNDKVQAYETQSQHDNATAESMQNRLTELEFRLKAEQKSVAALNERVRLKDEEEAEPAAKEPPPVSGDDAKSLFGARDLHIVDVYDVDGHGKTRKTFGRVYYVEKKFLLFYAFDLQDRTHNRAATAFQAWGYKEASSSSPQNLGVFDIDDVSLHRWVLKVDDPKVLEHIDVVFVTSERSPGSSSPNGRRLLYASLAGIPNHP
jgi:TolA-binding protein